MGQAECSALPCKAVFAGHSSPELLPSAEPAGTMQLSLGVSSRRALLWAAPHSVNFV